MTAQDDTVIIAAVGHEDAVLHVYSKGPNASAWATHVVDIDSEPGMSIAVGKRPTDASISPTIEAGANPSPALVVLPSGRVLLFAWLQTAKEVTTGTKSIKSWQITAWFSDDSGANFTKYQDYCLVEPLRQLVDNRDGTDGRYYPGRLRAEYKDGQILMVSSAYDTGSSTAQGKPAFPGNVYLQYASSSLGASFELVEKNDREANSTGAYDIAVSGGQFVISYVEYGTSAQIIVTRLGSAYTPLSRGNAGTISGTYSKGFGELIAASSGTAIGRVDQTICAVPDGSMYILATRHGSTSVGHTRHTVALFFSADNGVTWQETGGDWRTKNQSKDSMIWASRFSMSQPQQTPRKETRFLILL